MIHRATSTREPTLVISEQFVGFQVQDKSAVNYLFNDFTHDDNW